MGTRISGGYRAWQDGDVPAVKQQVHPRLALLKLTLNNYYLHARDAHSHFMRNIFSIIFGNRRYE